MPPHVEDFEMEATLVRINQPLSTSHETNKAKADLSADIYNSSASRQKTYFQVFTIN